MDMLAARIFLRPSGDHWSCVWSVSYDSSSDELIRVGGTRTELCYPPFFGHLSRITPSASLAGLPQLYSRQVDGDGPLYSLPAGRWSTWPVAVETDFQVIPKFPCQTEVYLQDWLPTSMDGYVVSGHPALVSIVLAKAAGVVAKDSYLIRRMYASSPHQIPGKLDPEWFLAAGYQEQDTCDGT